VPPRKRAVGGRPPVRLVARLIGEFILGAAADARRTFNGNLTQALLLTTIAHANVAHLTYDPATAEAFPPDGAPPDADRRPVSVQAVAAAMRMPYATAHRHINALIAQDYCQRVERRGVVAPVEVLRHPSIQADQEAIHQRFITMVAELERLGFSLPLAGDNRIQPTRQAVRRIEIDFLLSLLEICLGPADWDMVQLALFVALIALNTRDITYDAELAWRYAYAETPPPVEYYKPVSVRRLADAAGVPYETTRQCVNRLLERDQIERVAGGLIVKYAWNNGAGQQAMRQAFMGRFVRAMTALARIGIDFAEPPADET
jgi:hypothetical protein